MNEEYREQFLRHHGVKGMKWGIRNDRRKTGVGRIAAKKVKATVKNVKATVRKVKRGLDEANIKYDMKMLEVTNKNKVLRPFRDKNYDSFINKDGSVNEKKYREMVKLRNEYMKISDKETIKQIEKTIKFNKDKRVNEELERLKKRKKQIEPKIVKLLNNDWNSAISMHQQFMDIAAMQDTFYAMNNGMM